MSNRYQQWSYTDMEQAIEAFREVSKDYEEVNLEQHTILSIQYWVVRFRFHK